MLNKAKQVLPTSSTVQGVMSTIGRLAKRECRADNEERLHFANNHRSSFDCNIEESEETSFGSSHKDDFQFQRNELTGDRERQIPNSASTTFQKPKISSWDAGWNVTNAIQVSFKVIPYFYCCWDIYSIRLGLWNLSCKYTVYLLALYTLFYD